MSAGSPAAAADHGRGRRLGAIAVMSSLAILAVGCAAGGGAPQASAPASQTRSASAPPATSPPPELTLQITPAAYQLPAGISREVVLPHGHGLLIAGGLTPAGTSSQAVSLLNTATGRLKRAGHLAAPTHDAGGASVGGQDFVFGGGSVASVASVQDVTGAGTAPVAGRLPAVRSDLAAVTIAGTAYLVGGYDGASYDAAVLATTDGRRFRIVARLPVPVRYAAVTALDGQIWVFGGQTPDGITSVIQRVSLRTRGPGSGTSGGAAAVTGKATVAGHLPSPVTGASAFTLGGRIYLAGGQVPTGPARTATVSPLTALTTSATVLAFDPATVHASAAGRLPVPVSNAAVAVLGGTAFLVGGNNGQRDVPTVTLARLVPASQALPGTGTASVGTATGTAATGTGSSGAGGTAGALTASMIPANAPWLAPAHGRGHLAPHSDPSALPGDILIADDWNNRLLIVDPHGRIRWQFPRPGDLKQGQSFLLPDDAFFSPNGQDIIATEEEDSVISVISIAQHKIIYRYGTPGVPGITANHLSNPDDAMLTPAGDLLAADIKNCRVLLIHPPAHHPMKVIGSGGACTHAPPHFFGSPNGAFPETSGRYLVTEINGDWANEISLSGHVYWSVNPPGVSYPSDTNEIYPGRYLTADYSSPGQVVEFNSRGHLLWRFGGLNHPSLALPLPNGDILVNDDYNNRVIVIDPATNRIVWQYGHTGVPGTAPGYLNDPDGVDLTPPNSMLITHAATMGRP